MYGGLESRDRPRDISNVLCEASHRFIGSAELNACHGPCRRPGAVKMTRQYSKHAIIF